MDLDEQVIRNVLQLRVVDDPQALGEALIAHDTNVAYRREDGTWGRVGWKGDFHPSTDIAAAWAVVECLIDPDGHYGDQKWSFGLEHSTVVDWVCDFTPRRNHPKAREYPAFQSQDVRAPKAICRAALKAVRDE